MAVASGGTKTICAPAPEAPREGSPTPAGAPRREPPEPGEGRLRLGARNGEPVVEGAADADEQGDDGTEQGQPRDGDDAPVPERGAAEAREEGAHGSPGISRWSRNAAGGTGRCARGRRRRARR